MKLRILPAILIVGTLSGFAAEPASLKDAAPNTPLKLLEESTGGRLSPGFFWSPKLKKFVLFAGLHSGKQPHYDVEHLDLAKAKWTNAYPEGAAYKAESGPSDAPVHSYKRGGTTSLVDAKGVSRIPLAGGYYAHSAVLIHHQFALDPASGQLYTLFLNRLTILDVAGTAWRFDDTDAKTVKYSLKNQSAWNISGFQGPGCFMKNEVIHWGALCWDAVNKEVLSVGGCAMEKGGTPGTWVYKTVGKKWVKLKFGTPELKALQKKVDGLRNRSWALLSHARSRFFITESPKEAKVKLSAPCAKLKADLAAFNKELKGAKLPARFDAGRKYSLRKIGKYLSALDGIRARLDSKPDAAFLLEFRNAHRLLESAVFGLDDQPSGRAHSQTVFDPVNKKIVLFGGEGMDRSLGDTWVYDTETRQWKQKYPEVSPAPSAAHVLAWLPKAKKVALVGGYNKTGYRPFEIWTYDTAANKWALHKSVKPGKGRYRASWRGHNLPARYGNLATTGAVNDEDVMVLVENSRAKRITWALKIDASKTVTVEGTQPGAEAGSMIYSQEGPHYNAFRDRDSVRHKGSAYYEKKGLLEPEKMKTFFEKLPSNRWILFPKAPVRSPRRDYGTVRFDPARRQLLLWGGGHVNYFGTEVSHYSLRSGAWTAGEVPDEPLEPVFGMCLKVGMSFRHRPHITSHAYQYYDYDYTTGLMLVAKYGKTYAYDVAARRWLWPLIEGSVTGIRATPKGALGARDGSLVRFDREQWKWVELPVKGKLKPPGVRIDYSGFCYDQKRDAVWYFHAKAVRRYDMKTGETTLVTSKVAVKGLLREPMYIPAIDRVMFVNRSAGSDRHFFWNPEKSAWETAEIPLFNTDGKTKPAKPGRFGTGYGLIHDRVTGLVMAANGSYGRQIYALKLDAKKLKFTEVK